jgi:hypothetical protein
MEATASGRDHGESTPPCIVANLDYDDPGNDFDEYTGKNFDEGGG